MSENSRNQIDNLEKIDLIEILQGLLRNLTHTIPVMIIVFAMAFGYTYYRSSSTYAPVYTSTVTISVSDATDSSTNQAAASQLGNVFPYILTSGLLNDIVTNDIGYSSYEGSVSVTNIENTPLLDISVTASSKEKAEEILNSILVNYPQVAQYVVGKTTYTIVNPMTTVQTQTTYSVWGSALRSGVSAALAAGILLGIYYTLTYRTIRRVSDLRSISNVSYLGTLPVYRKKKRKNSSEAGINIMEANVQQGYLEALRQIRTKLLRHLKEDDQKIMMVTSSVPGEGKSTISANLAVSLAQAGNSVLLIDCDVRNPSVQAVLNLKGKYPGILQVLEKKTDFTEALVRYETDEGKLDLLLGAEETSEKVEIFGTKKMQNLLDSIREDYDYIILDTAPIAVLADAMIMSAYVDTSIYVIKCNYADRTVIMDGMKELKAAGIPITGCILNAGKESTEEYGYGKSSYYYGIKKDE